MKILKARNGIALMAVLVIMLITSLFIPVMFSMSDTSVSIAVKGTDRQRASYLARSVTEMSVAAFRKVDSKATNNAELTSEQAAFMEQIKIISDVNHENFAPGKSINSQTIYMLSKTESGVEDIRYTSDTTERDNLIDDEKYILIGEATCTITFDGSVHYYEIDNETNAKTEINKAANENDPMNKKDLAKRDKKYIEEILPDFNEKAMAGTADYTLTKVQNKNLIFTSVAEVNKIKATRTCFLVMKTEPSKDDWVVFGIEGEDNTGGNQVFVDPNKATSVVPISYSNEMIDAEYQRQPLLVYNCVGNMIIEPTNFKDVNDQIDSGEDEENRDGRTTVGVNGSKLVLGVQPGLNTAPDNDPSYNVLQGVNYDEQIKGEDKNENGVLDDGEDKNDNGKLDKDGVRYNNFVAFGATNAIRVGMPVNLLVNPCRAYRFGDMGVSFSGGVQVYDPNASLFKIMIFQAPVIQFTGRTDMMMSFYVRGDEKARRMSSIILTAPDSTPYSYYNEDRGKSVKAGMVYFEEDCYIWIIEYGDDGSSKDMATVYNRDSDFLIKKIANKGDVYYFNTEVEQVDCKCPEGQTECTCDSKKVGLSLTGWYLETKFLDGLNEEQKWWDLWGETKEELFRYYLSTKERTYYEDDFYYLGNVNAQNTVYSSPQIEDYYVVWTQ